MSALADKAVLIIGRGTGIAGAIAQAVREAGGSVIAAGRSPDAVASPSPSTAASTSSDSDPRGGSDTAQTSGKG